MEVLVFEFTARRYHATPWDAHVNEGRVEWPPCPWRLLRALIAVGYNKFGWIDGPPDTAVSLLKKLAACQPAYSLPTAIEAHTRHYMPSREGSREKRVKVFDSYLRVNNASDKLMVRYKVNLDNNEQAELKNLANGLAYLGRAESWVEADLLSEPEASEAAAARTWSGVATDASNHRVRLLAPLDDESFDAWRHDSVSQVADQAEATARREADAKDKNFTPAAAKKARQKAETPYPRSFIAALQQDTSNWQSAGWPRPPGSQWVDYELPPGVFDRKPLITIQLRPTFERPTAILLSIDGAGHRGTLRPRMNRVLPLMEVLHVAALKHADKLDVGHLPELTGTCDNGKPLKTPHTHAHWLPMSLFDPGAIDHVLVRASGGFSREAIHAISSIRWAYAKGISKLSVNMVGQGSIADIIKQLPMCKGINQHDLAAMRTATTWESATPLVLRKFLHRRGKKTPEGQIREELLERGLPEPISVSIWTQQQAALRKLKGFVLRRKPGKQQPPWERSWGVTIEFPEPVTGPINLGYASHYGLGMFRAST